MKPLVSVIIPAFNQQIYVSDAIQSVLAQSYPRVECICVDDGSSDRTVSVIESFGEAVNVLSQGNRGVSSARNEGVKVSKGDLVAFLDADDVWRRDKLARQLAILERSCAVISYSGMYRTDEALKILELMAAPSPDEALRNTLYMRQPSIFAAQTLVLQRKAFDELGGFNEALGLAADYEFAIRAASRMRMSATQAPLAFYRMHDKQMHRDTSQLERELLLAIDHLVNQGTINLATARNVRQKLMFDLGVHEAKHGRPREVLHRFRGAGRSGPALLTRYLHGRIKRAVGGRC